ncbi:hypothetical protein LguiB_005434 [Lonicera macranthoides]
MKTSCSGQLIMPKLERVLIDIAEVFNDQFRWKADLNSTLAYLSARHEDPQDSSDLAIHDYKNNGNKVWANIVALNRDKSSSAPLESVVPIIKNGKKVLEILDNEMVEGGEQMEEGINRLCA